MRILLLHSRRMHGQNCRSQGIYLGNFFCVSDILKLFSRDLLEVIARNPKLDGPLVVIYLLEARKCGTKYPGFILTSTCINLICSLSGEDRTPGPWRQSLPVSSITQLMMILEDQLFQGAESQHRARGWHREWQEIIRMCWSRCSSRGR